MVEGAAITFRHTDYCIIVMILISMLIVVTKRVLRSRAKFDCPWSVVGVADVDPELVDIDKLTAWLATGGRRVGLGDWRPEKSGHYGRFNVDKVRELADAA